MSTIMYVEINLICIVILLNICTQLRRRLNNQFEGKIFKHLIYSCIVVSISDIFWILLDMNVITLPLFVNVVVNSTYFIFSAIITYLWFIYSEFNIEAKWLHNKLLHIIFMLPILLIIIADCISQQTHYIFFIDDSGIYHRGSLFLLHFIVRYIYIIETAVKALIKSLNKNNFAKKEKYMSLALVGIYPIIGAALQILYVRIPFFCVGITIGLLQIFIRMQEQSISIDSLTQMSNRYHLIEFLDTKVKKYIAQEGKYQLYLLMLDMNHFKKINDSLGHIEGDKALIQVADTLKNNACGRSYLAARYGGDEFSIVCEVDTDQEIIALVDSIHKDFEAFNKQDEKNYSLSVSIGFAKWTKEITNLPEFFELADRAMYIEKEKVQN